MTANLTGRATSKYVLENTPTGLKITWQGKKDWARFSSNALSILLNLIVIWAIVYYTDASILQESGARSATVILFILAGAYLIYRIFRRVKDLTGSLLDNEIITFDVQAMTIERTGWLNIKRQVTYPADKIQSIRSLNTGATRSLYPVFTVGGDALTRYRLGTDQVFCRGINATDAAELLGKIHARFPQYRDDTI
jgi:hypothetical protein